MGDGEDSRRPGLVVLLRRADLALSADGAIHDHFDGLALEAATEIRLPAGRRVGDDVAFDTTDNLTSAERQ
jgi:hypothetical protein